MPAVAVRVTCVFCEKLALQVPGQLIPGGVLVTVPAPVVGAVTANWYNVGGGEPVPPHPARSRVHSTDHVQQNLYRDFMALLSEGSHTCGC